MRATIHTCDVCKQSKSENDLAQISVTTRGITISPNRNHPPITYDVCGDCLRKKGFAITQEPRNEEENAQDGRQNKAALETKLLDILENLGVMFYDT
jgi:hypothetical protein